MCRGDYLIGLKLRIPQVCRDYLVSIQLKLKYFHSEEVWSYIQRTRTDPSEARAWAWKPCVIILCGAAVSKFWFCALVGQTVVSTDSDIGNLDTQHIRKKPNRLHVASPNHVAEGATNRSCVRFQNFTPPNPGLSGVTARQMLHAQLPQMPQRRRVLGGGGSQTSTARKNLVSQCPPVGVDSIYKGNTWGPGLCYKLSQMSMVVRHEFWLTWQFPVGQGGAGRYGPVTCAPDRPDHTSKPVVVGFFPFKSFHLSQPLQRCLRCSTSNLFSSCCFWRYVRAPTFARCGNKSLTTTRKDFRGLFTSWPLLGKD